MSAKIALAKMVGCVWICQEIFCADVQWVGLIIDEISVKPTVTRSYEKYIEFLYLYSYGILNFNLMNTPCKLYFDCLKCEFAIQKNLNTIKYIVRHHFVDFLWKLNLKYVGHT